MRRLRWRAGGTGQPRGISEPERRAEKRACPARVLAELAQLLSAYDLPETGYTAQPAPKTVRFEGDYGHLSRRGEWDFDAPPDPEDVGQ